MSISYYATASTSSSIFILGGYTGRERSGLIAEYKDEEWFYAGRLNRARDSHNAITSGDLTMVVGGEAAIGFP